ncbi:MAG: hypothetical protein ACI4XH_00740 [Acutalibacteraceae bacterium]
MMKRIVALSAALVIILSLCACSKDDVGKQTQVNAGIVEYNTVTAFDYSDFLKEHEASAVKEGFANTKETTCIDKGTAKKLAINELESSFKYNTVRISYDRTEGIWMVTYSTTDESKNESNTLNVCIDDKGITQLIVKE